MAKTEQQFLNKLSAFLSLSVKQSKFIVLLAKAAKEHTQVESKVNATIGEGLSNKKSLTFVQNGNPADYFQRNFFSILFISLFISAKIPKNRRLVYGTILHCLRIIITAADNIIDKEQKGSVFLKACQNNDILNNVLLTLIAQKIIGENVKMIAVNTSTAKKTENHLINNLYSIAKGEDFTKTAVADFIPEPKEIIDKVHKKIGSELLGLALVAPLENEPDSIDTLKQFEQGILKIGLALQMMDDCVDIKEDLINDKLNLLASIIVHENLDGSHKPSKLKQLVQADYNEKKLFENSRRKLINNSIKIAFEGFETLSDGGYPVKKSEIKTVLKAIFSLRGLGQEWQQSS